MEGPVDELVQRILGACAGDARERAARIIAEATTEAEEEVKSLVKSAMKAALLRETAGALDGSHPVINAWQEPRAPIQAPEAPEKASAVSVQQGFYVYGIARLTDEPTVDVRGVTDAPLETVRHEGIAALVNQVPLDEFENALKGEAAQNLQWLETKARAHDSVLKALLSMGPVIPFRFCTIVRSERDVREMLRVHQPAIARTLEEFEGKQEYGVKITFDASLCEGASASIATTLGEAGGKGYLLNKKRRRDERGEAGRVARSLATECHQQLAALAADAVTLPTRRARELGEPVELLFKGAYLIPDTSLDRFRTLVDTLADRNRGAGLALQMTGPWPAYNFVRLDLSMEAAA